MTDWKPDETPKRKEEVAFRNYDGQAVVILLQEAETVVLNPVGRTVFELLDGTHTVAQIVEAVCGEYDVEADQARADVGAFLDELQSHGMLEARAG